MDGYSKIAHLMGHHNELAIFRRFSVLNFQNLLYLQAKLTHLEAELEELAKIDEADPGRANYKRDWWSLASAGDNDPQKMQWKKVLQIRKTLNEYSAKILSMVKRFTPLIP
jgi:hypothetical protein